MIDYKDVGEKYDSIMEFNQKAIQELTSALRDCRNELCKKCNEIHFMACIDCDCSECRWRDE